MTALEERLAVVAEARTWRGTPHRHRQAVKGAGVDCALFIMQAFVGAGLAKEFDPGFYTHDWHMHRGDEIYLDTVRSYMIQLDDLCLPLNQRVPLQMQPADVIMMRVGRTYSHGVMVTEWPRIIHAYFPSGIVEEVDVTGTPLMTAPARLFSFWGADR